MADNDNLRCSFCDRELDPCDRLTVAGNWIGWHNKCDNVYGLWSQSASRHRQYCHVINCDQGPPYPWGEGGYLST